MHENLGLFSVENVMSNGSNYSETRVRMNISFLRPFFISALRSWLITTKSKNWHQTCSAISSTWRWSTWLWTNWGHFPWAPWSCRKYEIPSHLESKILSIWFICILDHGSTQIWLAKNPLECNCEMEWVQRINTLAATSPREFPSVKDWHQLQCTLNNRGPLQNASIALSQVRPSEFLCSYETHCFALCMCCDFFACDCRMKCSEGCDCFHDQTWSSNIIECGRRGHASVPEFIPMDATAVYLDGNNFDSKALINDEFIGRKHLTSLYLNNSQIKIISNQTFKGMQTDSEIHKYVITEKGLLLILFPLLYISRIDRTSSLTSRG